MHEARSMRSPRQASQSLNSEHYECSESASCITESLTGYGRQRPADDSYDSRSDAPAGLRLRQGAAHRVAAAHRLWQPAHWSRRCGS